MLNKSPANIRKDTDLDPGVHMSTHEHFLAKLLRQGEDMSNEFKSCRTQLNRNVYETVCAFLNRHGGNILLGVQDSGEVQGIDPGAVARIKRDFATAIN